MIPRTVRKLIAAHTYKTVIWYPDPAQRGGDCIGFRWKNNMAQPEILFHCTCVNKLEKIRMQGLLPFPDPLHGLVAVWMAREIGYARDHNLNGVILEINTADLDPALLSPWVGVPIEDRSIVTAQYTYKGNVPLSCLRVHGTVEWGGIGPVAQEMVGKKGRWWWPFRLGAGSTKME